MTDWNRIARTAIAASPAEQRRAAVPYLDRRETTPGEAVATGRERLLADHLAALACLDRTLEAHRGDLCWCLLIDLATGAVRTAGATQPPFLRGAAPTLAVIAKGTTADLDAASDDIAARITPEDSLPIHTNNRGGWGD
jgi:hypothetical protein